MEKFLSLSVTAKKNDQHYEIPKLAHSQITAAKKQHCLDRLEFARSMGASRGCRSCFGTGQAL
jgi:hypothetical protein